MYIKCIFLFSIASKPFICKFSIFALWYNVFVGLNLVFDVNNFILSQVTEIKCSKFFSTYTKCFQYNYVFASQFKKLLLLKH